MSIEVVFFDAGETLLRPEPSFPELAASIISGRGHDVTASRVIEAGRAVSHHFRQAAEEGRVFSASADESRAFWLTFYGDLLGQLGIGDEGAPEALFATFSNPDSYGLFPDSVPVLQTLAERGLRLGVISNFEGWLRGMLGSLGIADRFEVLAISGDLGWEKPDRRIFEWALAEAGVDAARCAHVGDQPYFDAEAATACGLHGVLLDRHERWTDVVDFPKIRSLDELPALLETL